MLRAHGNEVECLVFDNKDIRSWYDKILAGLFVIYNPVSRRIVKKRILEFKPDVIHVHNFVPLASPSIFFVARKYNIPVILTLHNYRLLCPSVILFYDQKIYERSIGKLFPIHAIMHGVYRNSRFQTLALVMMTLVHRMLKTWKTRVTRYVALTRFAKSKFEQGKLGFAPGQLVVKPNFVQDQGAGEEAREDFFLFVGRLAEEKGIHTLLEACRNSDMKVVIIGDGPLREVVEQHAAVNPAIRYLGFQPRSVVVETMKKCRALIFPSIWYEGFPMTILEAFSTGTLVIASRLGSMAEVVEDGKNGLHFEPGDAASLREKMRHILHDQDLARSLSAYARETYLKRYAPEINYQQIMGLYREAIAAAISS